MRILCLHGVGSSASICERQFGPFLKAVDPSYEFVFVDGPVSSDAGPGVDAHFEGPFFSHTAGYSPDQMVDALDHLEETIDELGPFDGVLGFSQGAAMAVSYIYQKQECGEPAPFKFALCFSSVVPFSADARCCRSVIQRLCALQRDVTAAISPSSAAADELVLGHDELLFVDLLLQTVIPARKKGCVLPDYDMNVYTNGDGSEAPRLMHPQLLKERIRIPTVHVSGKHDFGFMRNMSDTARGLCEEKLTRKLEHSGRHHPPQKDVEVKAAVRAMEWAINQAGKLISCF